MDTCRVDIDIAEQVRPNDVWMSVLLPRTRRPSLSAEERSEAERQYRDSYRDSVPLAEWGRYVDARNARTTMGTLRQGIFAEISEGLPFDGAQPCFDAIGDYLIDQRGVEFHFVTSLPGDLNRFVMERVDIDDDHSRLNLTHGDCRLELTISSSILAKNEWVPRSIAPFITPKLTVISVANERIGDRPSVAHWESADLPAEQDTGSTIRAAARQLSLSVRHHAK
jgi:hypothetical protein